MWECCRDQCGVTVGAELVLVLVAIGVSDPTASVGHFDFVFLTLLGRFCFASRSPSLFGWLILCIPTILRTRRPDAHGVFNQSKDPLRLRRPLML